MVSTVHQIPAPTAVNAMKRPSEHPEHMPAGMEAQVRLAELTAGEK